MATLNLYARMTQQKRISQARVFLFQNNSLSLHEPQTLFCIFLHFLQSTWKSIKISLNFRETVLSIESHQDETKITRRPFIWKNHRKMLTHLVDEAGRLLGLMHDVGKGQSKGREDPCIFVQEDRLHAQALCNSARMLSTGATEACQSVLRRVMAFALSRSKVQRSKNATNTNVF